MASLSTLQTNALALDWLSGVNDGVLRRCSYPVPDTPWYLLPVQWLNQWKAGLSSDLPSINILPFLLAGDRYLLEAVNSLLRPVKSDLVALRDYVLVPEKAWKHFTQTYGCEKDVEIKRVSQVVETYKTAVEVQLEGLQLAFVYRNGKDIVVTDAKLAYFSRLDSLYFVRNTLKEYFIKEYSLQLQGEYIIRLWILTSPLSDLKSAVSKPSSDLLFPGKLLTDEVKLYDISPKTSIFIAEVREQTQEKVFFALHEMACETCTLQIGIGGLTCLCNSAYFCDKMCMSKHKCALFSPVNSEEERCCYCTASVIGTAYMCKCMEVLCKQRVYCGEECYRIDGHVCREMCGKCGSEMDLHRVKCDCGEEEFCCQSCASSHDCNQPHCQTCHLKLYSDAITCKCQKVRH
jgi:hypothetical protein